MVTIEKKRSNEWGELRSVGGGERESELPWDYSIWGLGRSRCFFKITDQLPSFHRPLMGPPSSHWSLSQARLTGRYGQAPPPEPFRLLLNMYLSPLALLTPQNPYQYQKGEGRVLNLGRALLWSHGLSETNFLVKQTGECSPADHASQGLIPFASSLLVTG